MLIIIPVSLQEPHLFHCNLSPSEGFTCSSCSTSYQGERKGLAVSRTVILSLGEEVGDGSL